MRQQAPLSSAHWAGYPRSGWRVGGEGATLISRNTYETGWWLVTSIGCAVTNHVSAALVARGVRTEPATSWRRVSGSILLHPDVVGFPLVEHVAAPGLATQRVENP